LIIGITRLIGRKRLHAYGVDALSGFIITNPNGMADAVARGAKPWDFAPFGRVVLLRREATSQPRRAQVPDAR
jgi:uncharacterized protein